MEAEENAVSMLFLLAQAALAPHVVVFLLMTADQSLSQEMKTRQAHVKS